MSMAGPDGDELDQIGESLFAQFLPNVHFWAEIFRHASLTNYMVIFSMP